MPHGFEVGFVARWRGLASWTFHPLWVCWGDSPRPKVIPELFIMLDALVVAPHPDDAELGMGGTIVRLIQQGWSLGIVDLTNGEPTALGNPDRRAVETAPSNAALGNPWRRNLGLPNRSLEPSLIHRRSLAAIFR